MSLPLTDHEIVAMTQQYTQTHDGEYVTHLAYQEINRQVAAGRGWAKCQDCGNPFPQDREGSSSERCSLLCRSNYADYLKGAWG